MRAEYEISSVLALRSSLFGLHSSVFILRSSLFAHNSRHKRGICSSVKSLWNDRLEWVSRRKAGRTPVPSSGVSKRNVKRPKTSPMKSMSSPVKPKPCFPMVKGSLSLKKFELAEVTSSKAAGSFTSLDNSSVRGKAGRGPVSFLVTHSVRV